MFDWFGSLLLALLLNAWLPYIVGLVVGLIIGYGWRDLRACFHPERETSGAAYDACAYDILDEVEMIVDGLET